MPGPGEPLWSDEDRAWALAYLAEDAAICTCGQPVSESMDAQMEFGYQSDPVTCHACKARDKASEAWSRDGGSPHGVRFVVRRLGR